MSDGRVIIDTEINNSKLEGQLNGLNGTMTAAGTTAGANLGKGMQSETQKAGTKVSNSLSSRLTALAPKMKAVGTKMSIGITTPVVAGFAKMTKAASDYDENMNKVDVAFGSSAKAVKKFASTATSQFGLSRNSALEMTSQFGDMGTSMGLSQSSAANMSISLAGLAGDLASFKNISTDEAMTGLNGIFTGETESLKQLGVVMTETNLKQFASDQGLVYDSMSQSEKVQLRYNYVMSQTKNAQGDYARTADGTANSARTFKESLENLCITLGQNLLPIITPVIQKLTAMIQKFGTAPKSVQKMILAIAAIAAAVGPALIAISSIVTAVNTLKEISVVTKLIGGMGTAFKGLWAIVAANPVAAVVIAIIAVFLLLYTKCEPFRKFINNMFETIKNAVVGFGKTIKNAFNAVVSFFTGIPAKLASAGETIKNAAVKVGKFILLGIAGPIPLIYEAIKKVGPYIIKGLSSIKSSVLNAAKKIGNTVIDGFKSVIPGAKTIGRKIGSVFSSGVSGAKSLASRAGAAIKNAAINALKGISSVTSIGANIVRGLWSGISNKTSWLKSQIRGFVGNVKNFLKRMFGVHSPSTFTTWIGEMLDEGLAGGIIGKTKLVTNALKGQFQTVSGVYQSVSVPSLSAGSYSGVSGQNTVAGAMVEQNINIYQKVESPADTARAIRHQAITLGLAGV